MVVWVRVDFAMTIPANNVNRSTLELASRATTIQQLLLRCIVVNMSETTTSWTNVGDERHDSYQGLKTIPYGGLYIVVLVSDPVEELEPKDLY